MGICLRPCVGRDHQLRSGMIGSGLLIHCINAPLRQSKRIEGCTKPQPLSYKNSTSIVSQTASSAPLPCPALAFRYSHFRVSAQWSRALQHSEITQAEIDYMQQPNGLKSLATMVFDCV